jgi:hypothetical protein
VLYEHIRTAYCLQQLYYTDTEYGARAGGTAVVE